MIMGRFLMLRLGLFVIFNDLEVEMDQRWVRDRACQWKGLDLLLSTWRNEQARLLCLSTPAVRAVLRV